MDGECVYLMEWATFQATFAALGQISRFPTYLVTCS